MHAVKAG